MISPCLISPAGIAFFTAQMITSPTWATFRLNLPLLLDPRSTLMHIACLAPVLSAMSKYGCCWIIFSSTGILPVSQFNISDTGETPVLLIEASPLLRVRRPRLSSVAVGGLARLDLAGGGLAAAGSACPDLLLHRVEAGPPPERRGSLLGTRRALPVARRRSSRRLPFAGD